MAVPLSRRGVIASGWRGAEGGRAFDALSLANGNDSTTGASGPTQAVSRRNGCLAGEIDSAEGDGTRGMGSVVASFVTNAGSIEVGESTSRRR